MSSLRCTYSGGGDYHYFKGGEALNVHSLYVHGVSESDCECVTVSVSVIVISVNVMNAARSAEAERMN